MWVPSEDDPRAGGTHVTTLHSDVLVLGSTLGGLIAANYLARTGLRVVLLEEEVQAKRPALLREPFLLSGLGPGGPVRRVLRELALPLIEQREIRRGELALQVLLPGTRIDVGRGRAALARELEAHGFADAEVLRAWLDAVDAEAATTHAELWQEAAQRRGRGISRLLPEPNREPLTTSRRLPAPPNGLGEFVAAQLAALSALDSSQPLPAPALLLHMTREGAFRMPHAEAPFLGLFRRRLETLYGEIRPIGAFGLVMDRKDVGLELPRGRLLARALVIAVPHEPLRAFLAKTGSPPAWLRPSPPPLEAPIRIFRAERDALPQGMAERVIRADGTTGEPIHWLARSPDPSDRRIEWLVAFGPGAQHLPARRPLGELAPLAGGGIVAVDPGPTPAWDLDASGLRFLSAGTSPWLRQSPPVVTVGPELAPGLGFEGELLGARQVARSLAERLGARPRAV